MGHNDGHPPRADRPNGAADPTASTVTPPAPPFVPRQVGQYTLTRVISSGGMGTVYEALQHHPRRTVAVKLVRAGLASPTAIRRFEYESQILARLHHPHVAQIYEAGQHVEGAFTLPYFAMEYVPGARTLTEFAAAKHLGLRERLELFVKVCDAVQHGHHKGIIHRDLKPANILVDSSGEPKIIDFGVARAVDSDLGTTAFQTQAGQLVGTVAYMSPEQVDADPRDLDVRSDVYALGIVLYELLTGRLPYDVGTPPHSAAARVIREVAPARLSTAAGDRALRGDVETIVFKALEKDRDRRYQSAHDLQQDLLRYLRSEPITARPPSFGYQLRVFARRHRRFVMGLAAVFATLVLGLIATSHQVLRARRAEGQLRSALEAVQVQYSAAERAAYAAGIAAADGALRDHDVAAAREQLALAPAGLRGWEWRYLAARLDQSLRTFYGHTGDVGPALFTPSGERLVSIDDTGVLRIWDAARGRETSIVRGLRNGHGALLDVSPDGRWIAALSASDGSPRLIDVATGMTRPVAGLGGGFDTVRFAPDGMQLAVLGKESRLVDMRTDRVTLAFPPSRARVLAAAFCGDGTALATAALDGQLQLLDARNGRTIWRRTSPLRIVLNLAASPDGSTLALASPLERTVSLLGSARGESRGELRGHGGSVNEVAFDPSGSRLATASNDGTVRVWNAVDCALITTLHGHAGHVVAVRFDAAGQRLLTAGGDGTLKLWDVAPRVIARAGNAKRSLTNSKLGASGRWLAGFSSATDFQLVHADTGVVQWSLAAADGVRAGRGVLFSPDGETVAVGRGGDAIALHAASSGARLCLLQDASAWLSDCAFAADGKRLACGAADRTVRIWDATSGALVTRLAGHRGQTTAIAFAPSGALLASGDALGEVLVWRPETTTPTARLDTERAPVADVAFAGSDTRLVALTGSPRAAEARTGGLWIMLWDVKQHAPVCQSALSLDGKFPKLAVDAAGTTVALVRLNRPEVPLVHLPSCRQLLTLPPSVSVTVESAAFTPGRCERLVATGLRGEVAAWDPCAGANFAAELAVLDQAGAVITRRFETVGDAEQVIASLRDDTRLDPALREATLRLVLEQASRLDALAAESRDLTSAVTRSAEEYRLALEDARTAVRYRPDVDRYQSALGAALYRTGDYEAALTALRRVAQSAQQERPQDTLFTAMSLARLGRIGDARAALAQVRDARARAGRNDDDVLELLLAEAEALVGETKR